MKNPMLLLLVALLASCTSLKTTKSSDDEIYREDLSSERPDFTIPPDTVIEARDNRADYATVMPVNDVTGKLNNVLDEGDELREEVETVDGYTIQVYTGLSSDEARIIKGKIVSLLPDEEVELFYDEPSFKVQAGKYLSRIEAQKSFTLLKKRFPKAIIIPDKIAIP